MEKIIQFDICAMVLLLVILFSTIFRKMTKGSSNRMFLVLMGTMVLATAFSILCTVFDNMNLISDGLLSAIHGSYLLFHNLSSVVYVLFVISMADTWHKILNSKLQLALLIIPMTILFGFLIADIFNDCMFTVENSIYTHQEMFNIVYVISGFYMGLGVIYLLIYRKYVSKMKIVSLISMVLFMIVAIVVQFLEPLYTVEMFAGALSMLIITMTTQRPEEILDARTGLGNYNAYAENVKRSFDNGKNFSIIMLNIGNFPSIQSMLTYDSTVMLLKSIANEITNIDKYEIYRAEAYYLDRGRFRMVIGNSHFTKAPEVAEMLRKALKANITINNLSIEVDMDICTVTCPKDIKDFTTLASFGANFHERSNEKDKVIFAADLFKQEKFDMKNNIDIIIDRAIKNHNFKVYYQPIYSVEQGRFTTAEALLRLIDDEYGFVPPDMFIPAAEKTGAIHKIGDYVLNEVCKFISSDEFKKLGLDYIEINLSVAQCMHGDLADKILKTLEKHNISSDKINLEITETAVSFGQNAMKQNLDKLSDAGVSFSLDDYGTGYSNMKRVVQLPLKIVKLDKSFVDEQNNPKMWIVLQNTVKMLKDMNMEIVVEGIETEKMVEQFTDLNCDYIQGYYFSKPIPEDQFVEFIKKAHSV